jgi:uncharacterized protein YjbI with pentapeptide repeats
MENFEYIKDVFTVVAIIGAVVYGVLHFISEYKDFKSSSQRRAEYMSSFDKIVTQLSSDAPPSQLSAAILLRRFFSVKLDDKSNFLKTETVNVISSILRTVPPGVYQKTLGDSLAYAIDLSGADLQKTNLQDIYIGNKKSEIILQKTDFFMADLSYALIDGVQGQEAILYHAILFDTQIKNSNFENANFSYTDLTNTKFENVRLKGANFSHALNIPIEIQSHLENGKYKDSEAVTTQPTSNDKTIFFSIPGCMTKEQELLTKEYKRILEAKRFKVIYYYRDIYPGFGQYNRVRQSILKSDALIAFGFKQISIEKGVYRPNTSEKEELNNRWMPTPWNELEIGMGLMKGLPILLIKDVGIESGAFNNNLRECFTASISADYDLRQIDSNEIFTKWCARI